MLEPKIEIDHQVLLNNVKLIKERLDQNVKMMAVVKSNAYGHGMAEIAKTLETEVDMFGVGFLEEGVALRKTTDKEILVMGPVYDFDIAVQNNCIIALESMYQFKAMLGYVDKHLKGTDVKLRIHIKIDTGMHRFGISLKNLDEVLNTLDNKKMLDNVSIEGVYSHFAATYNSNPKTVEKQYEIFKKAKTYMKNHFHGKVMYHIANSENGLDTKKYNEDMVRIGNGLYGGMYLKNPLATKRIGKIYLPIMSIHTLEEKSRFGYGFRAKGKTGMRIGAVKTGFYEGMGMYKLPVGQGNLYKFKALSKRVLKAFLRKEMVYYNGRAIPVVGMVNMQYFQIDLTDTNIMVGDFVELTKEPLFYDDGVNRVHLWEGKDETDY